MRLVSVNVARPRKVSIDGRTYATGIYKTALAESVWLGQLNLAGDGQGDLVNHGGQYQAVYCYPHEHYAYWSERLGRDDFAFGQFGENFTTQGLLENEVFVGDKLRVGEALIQVTQPRVPCYKLAHKMGIRGFDKTFLQANRSGFYAQVLEEGQVAAGDPIERVSRDPVGMTVAKVNAALLLDKNPAAAERALGLTALSPEWRGRFEKMLAKT